MRSSSAFKTSARPLETGLCRRTAFSGNPTEMQRSESVIKGRTRRVLATFAAEDTNVVEALLDEANGRLDDVFAEVQRRGILIVPFVVGKRSTLAAALEAAELEKAGSSGLCRVVRSLPAKIGPTREQGRSGCCRR